MLKESPYLSADITPSSGTACPTVSCSWRGEGKLCIKPPWRWYFSTRFGEKSLYQALIHQMQPFSGLRCSNVTTLNSRVITPEALTTTTKTKTLSKQVRHLINKPQDQRIWHSKVPYLFRNPHQDSDQIFPSQSVFTALKYSAFAMLYQTLFTM